jgi:hypothetical protein
MVVTAEAAPLHPPVAGEAEELPLRRPRTAVATVVSLMVASEEAL